MSSINQEEKQLRSDVQASEGKEVAVAARQFMQSVRNPHIQNAVGGHPGDLQHFARIFSQGMQWVYEQFPHVPGPEAVLMGPKGGKINYKNYDHPVNTIALARRLSGKDCFVIIPFEAVISHMDEHRAGVRIPYNANSRQSLGAISGEEAIFLAGVEEAYHAVQNQDPIIRQKYQLSDLTTSIEVSSGASDTVHDYSQREKDVVPIMEQALQEFLRRKSQQSAHKRLGT